MFTFVFLPLNLPEFSAYGNAVGGSSSSGHVGPCFSENGVSSSATFGPKVSGTAAPMVTSDVKSSQAASNSATKTVTSSRTTAKVTFNMLSCENYL
jgi:hypothetical protein